MESTQVVSSWEAESVELLPGDGFLQHIGHNSPQILLDAFREEVTTVTETDTRGTRVYTTSVLDVEQREGMREVFDADGDLVSSVAFHSWTSDDGNTELTRYQQEGRADEYTLTKVDEAGNASMQRFIEGSQDTTIIRETQEGGWQVIQTESASHDLAAQTTLPNVPAEVPTTSTEEQRIKAQGSVADLQALIGSESFNELLANNSDFRQAMETLDGQQLTLVQREWESEFTDLIEEENRHHYIHRSERDRTEAGLTITAGSQDGQGLFLSQDLDSGAWTVAFADPAEVQPAPGAETGLQGASPPGSPQPLPDFLDSSGELVNSAVIAQEGAALLRAAHLGDISRATNLIDLGVRFRRGAELFGQDLSSPLRKAEVLGPLGDGLGMVLNTRSAIMAAMNGELQGVGSSLSDAAIDAGSLAQEIIPSTTQVQALRLAANLGKSLGVVGAGVGILSGLTEMTQGDALRGGLQVAGGVGSMVGLLAASGSWAGPAGWVVAGGAGGLLMAYDHWDSTGIAPLQI